MRRYDFVLLDADNTLFDFDRSEHEALRLALEAFSIPCPPETEALYVSINSFLWAMLDRGVATREWLVVERFARLTAALGVDADPAALNRTYLDRLGEQSFLLPGAQEVCRALGKHCTLAILTNQYIVQAYGTGDPARLGAQVISGIGFLGAGTIIVTGRHKVKGLTTAAGLWASACMGLAIGIGFYEAAIITCVSIWFVTAALHRFDNYVLSKSNVVEMYVEFGCVGDISSFISKLRAQNIRVTEMEITKSNTAADAEIAAVMLLQSGVKRDHAEMLAIASDVQGVKFVEAI